MIVNDNDYKNQINDWHTRLPSHSWRAHFQSLEIPLDGKKLLDCGCGPGHYGKILSSLGAIVTGYDKEDRCLLSASKVIPEYKQLIKGDIESISKFKMTFDIILLRYVLHHLEQKDRKNALSDLYNMLKNDGYLVIETSFEDHFRKHYDHILYPRLTDALLKVYPSREEIFSWLYDIGFTNIKETEISQKWESYGSLQDALNKSKELVLYGKGPTAWLLLSKEERSQFHKIRSETLVKIFSNGVVPRYWHSSYIVAKK